MCSNASGGAEDNGLVGRLGSAIDDVAAVAKAGEHAPDRELAARLATAWELIAAADPEVADRAAKYSD